MVYLELSLSFNRDNKDSYIYKCFVCNERIKQKKYSYLLRLFDNEANIYGEIHLKCIPKYLKEKSNKEIIEEIL
jgi:hypothetical protein